MTQVIVTSNTSNLDTVSDLARYTSVQFQSIIGAVNGNLELGTNLKSKLLTVNFTASNTQVQMAHNLGKTPTAIILAGSNAATSIYSAKSADSTYVYLMSSAIANTTVLIF